MRLRVSNNIGLESKRAWPIFFFDDDLANIEER